MLLVAYPLSIGPVAWLGMHGYIPCVDESSIPSLDRFLIVVYWPLKVLSDNFDPFQRLTEWYVSLWTSFPVVIPPPR